MSFSDTLDGGTGGPSPPPHFSVENKGIIRKKLINAAAGFGPLGPGMARPPHFKLRSSIYGNPQKQKYISGTIHRTKMADHFLETPDYEQVKYPGLVCLKVIKSIE